MISPLLYVTFWSMTMYDLNAPKERYDAEIEKLKVAITDVDMSKEIVRNYFSIITIGITEEKVSLNF